MQTTIFIARLMGPVLALAGLSMLFNRAMVQALAREVLASDALIFISGLLTLPLGLAIVNTHNVWSGWPALITAFGWIAVVAGVARIALPGPLKRIGASMVDNQGAITAASAIMATLGLFLSFQGYLA